VGDTCYTWFIILTFTFSAAAAGGVLISRAASQEKVLSPKQMSGLESLLVPPLAAAWQRITGSRQHAPILFGAQLSGALQRAAAAASSSGQGSCHAGQHGQLLQQAMQQQTAAADKQYLLLVTSRRDRVSASCCLNALYLAFGRYPGNAPPICTGHTPNRLVPF
jgi:hypothetical protein